MTLPAIDSSTAMDKASKSALHALSLTFACASLLTLSGCDDPQHAAVAPRPDPLITGKYISPPSGLASDVGSMPMNLALSPDGRFAIVSDIGLRQHLWSIDTSTVQSVGSVDFSNAAPSAPAIPGGKADIQSPPAPASSYRTNGLYYGLAISPSGAVYAAQGGHDSIAILALNTDGKLTLKDTIPTRANDFPAGLALDDLNRLYVANNASGIGNPFDLTASVAIYDTSSKSELGRYTFKDSFGGTSNFPLGIAALRDGSKVYVASERDDAVYVLDTRNPSSPAFAAKLSTGAHPVTLLLTRDQHALYVANSLSDTVSVVDTANDRITATILLRPTSARELRGVTPLGLALSPDEHTLYAALADMNAIAVIDTPSAQLRGYLPAAWYPTSLAVAPDGAHLLVANAKGASVRNPSNRPDPRLPRRKSTALLSLLEGNVCLLDVLTDDALKKSTTTVLAQNRLTVADRAAHNPLHAISLASGNIKHVFYVIKENRTYDQVLGDLPQGNGDTSLTLFGREVTPNQHALAERFVLLDNLFCCGEVSGDGWAWSTQGMADAYVQRNVSYHYSHRGRKFDFEGASNGYPSAGAPAADDDGKPVSTAEHFGNGVEPAPNPASTNRSIWDAAHDAGITLRNYGFFLFFADTTTGTPGGPDNYPLSEGLLPGARDLAGITDLDYRRFDLDYPDSDAPAILARQSGDADCLYPKTEYGRAHAPSRFSEWNREFQMMLAKDPTGAAVPALNLIRLGNDHTSGASQRKHSPRSDTADNDFAVGQLVEAVSHSPIWSSSAVFIIEDDAQDGVDHVDAHRTTAYVISPWIKAHSVDHHFANTDTLLRTMELILGLKPLCQYDAIADPIMNWDNSPSNIEPYSAILPPKDIIAQHNPAASAMLDGDPRMALALASDRMDFTHADAAPARRLNQIIWKTVKGPASEMPSPRGVPTDVDDDDDDD